jgi:hypothetical protein
MSPIFAFAYISLSQVRLQRGDRARGLILSANVVLHDSLPYFNLVLRIQVSYLLGALYLAAFAPAFVIADFIALVETNSST